MNRNKHELEDAVLVELTLSGDRDAFDQLVRRYRDQVFRLTYTKTHRFHEAEDLAQDAFVLAYKSLRQLREHSRFAPWLRRTAENLCNMWLRSQRVELVPLDEDMQASSQGVDEAVQKKAEVSRVYDALLHLSEVNRLASVLYFVDGFSMREIAEFLDLPVGTVKRRINLSRTQLKKEMLDMVKDTLGAQKPTADFSVKVAAKIDVMRWYTRFSEYIDVGVSLVRSLSMLAQGDYPEIIRQETLSVQHAIEQGSRLSDALTEHAPTLNHPLTLGLVRSGEVGGVLEQGLRTIVAWMEREDMNRKIDVAYWLRTFAFMLSSGVPLLTTLETMKSVVPSDPLQTVPDVAINAIRQGKILSEALQEFPDVFSPVVMALIRAGERQGSMDVAVTMAAIQIMREANELMQSDPYIASIKECEGGLVDELRRQLSNESAPTRAGALEALEQMTGAASVYEYVKALSDADATVRLAAAKILAKHPASEAADALAAAATDASPQVRRAALDALLLAEPKTAFKMAEAALADQDVDVRRAGIRVLRASKKPESAVLLAGALGDRDLLVASPAMKGLVELGNAALPVLFDTALPDMLGRVRRGELEATGLGLGLEVVSKISPGDARKYALALLDESVPSLRWIAARCIEDTAEPEDRQVLVDLLKESSTAPHAATALARLEAVDAVPALQKALDYDYDADWIKQRITWAIEAIRSA